MKTVLGLLKADSGTVEVAGEKVVYGNSPTNRHVGYLPDVPEFYSFMTAPEYLRFCGEITGMTNTDIKKRSGELLELVGLSGERHRIGGFSRGMKQRLGIAQALINSPRLLICDEPTSALDPVGRKEILDILTSAREKTTVIFSTHILSDVERICTDVAFLKDGKAELQGNISDVKSRYGIDEYSIETDCGDTVRALLERFPAMTHIRGKLSFRESDVCVFDVLAYISEKRLPTAKIERCEPTLESLFMEAESK